MTFEELMDSTPPMQQHALVKGYQAGFAAGAASRDAEIAELVAALEHVIGMRFSLVTTKLCEAALAKVRKP